MSTPKKNPRKKKAKKPTINQIIDQQHREMVKLIRAARNGAFDPDPASHLPYHSAEWVGPMEE